MVSVIRDLIRIDSVESKVTPLKPFGDGCAEALDFTLGVLHDFSFNTKNLDNYCGYAEIGEGELVGVLGHLDVVPVGPGWSFPPFAAELHDGKIYGRGAVDDKGPTVVSIFAAAKLLNEGYIPKKRLRFILGCDEESGWKCMEHYAKTEEIPAIGFSPDADFPVINCEKGIVRYRMSMPIPHGFFEISGGTRSNVVPDIAVARIDLQLYESLKHAINKLDNDNILIDQSKDQSSVTITTRGKSAHASTPYDGDNAIIKLLSILGETNSELLNISRAFSSYDGSCCNLNLSDSKSGALTLNLGTVSIINAQLVFELDIRFPVSISKGLLINVLKNKLKFLTINEIDGHDPLFVDQNDPLVKTLLNAYDKVMFTKSKPITIGGGTYARFLPHGVAFGPSFPDTVSVVHQKDECISLKDLALAFDIYYEALKNLVFK
jgi:succinyl-diaminopimelate desuccinylase